MRVSVLLSMIGTLAASALSAQIPTALPVAPTEAEADTVAQRFAGLRQPSIRATLSEEIQQGRKIQGWFPVMSAREAVAFWVQGSARPLNSGAVTVETDAVAANVDLLSDVIGAFKVNFGIVAAGGAPGSEEGESGGEQEEDAESPDAIAAVTRLVSKGGLTNVSAFLPVYYLSSTDRKSTRSILLIGRGGFEGPEEGKVLQSPAASGTVGVELAYSQQGNEGTINFESSAFGQMFGFNDTYAEKMKTENRTAAIAGVRLAFVLGRTTRVGLIYRPLKTDTFDALSRFAVYIQQVATP